MRTIGLILVCFGGAAILGGCGGYATPTPDGGSDLSALKSVRSAQTDYNVDDSLKATPLAQLPTAIAVARVEGSIYSGPGTGGGASNFQLVSTRDVEKPEFVERLDKLPMVSGIAPISPLMLPDNPSANDLRRAAGALHADMLMIYTLQTSSDVSDALLPLSVVTLGLSPTETVRANCAASAVLLDTRNGYVYGTMEASDHSQQLASAWTCEAATEAARGRSEQSAFGKLTDQMNATWGEIVKQVQAARPAAAAVR